MTTIALSEFATLDITFDGFVAITVRGQSVGLTRDETEALYGVLHERHRKTLVAELSREAMRNKFGVPVTEKEVKACMENPVVLSPEDEAALEKAKVRLFKQLGIKEQ